MGIAYRPHQLHTCGQCLLPDDPMFNDCGSTSTDPGWQNSGLHVWPIPATDAIHLFVPDYFRTGMLEIYSITGKRACQQVVG